MSINLDFVGADYHDVAYADYRDVVGPDYRDGVCADRHHDVPECRERTVRAIGEILPLVMARYGLDNTGCDQRGAQESPEIDDSIWRTPGERGER